MKLYATVQSERATKGQGGNDYLQIDVKGEGGQLICDINVTIRGGDYVVLLNGDEDEPIIKRPVFIKGKKQEGEKTGACGIPGHGTYCRTCFK